MEVPGVYKRSSLSDEGITWESYYAKGVGSVDMKGTLVQLG